MKYPELENLIDVIEQLMHPETGCPWDLKQTHHSLLPYLIEEAYEFIEATEKQDFSHMQEEIGDVLLQVLLHSILARKKGEFTLESVCKTLADKMVRRHPHVFANPSKRPFEQEEIIENWNSIKESEKVNSSKKYLISEKCLLMPALKSASKIGRKTRDLCHLKVLCNFRPKLGNAMERAILLKLQRAPILVHQMSGNLVAVHQITYHASFMRNIEFEFISGLKHKWNMINTGHISLEMFP